MFLQNIFNKYILIKYLYLSYLNQIFQTPFITFTFFSTKKSFQAIFFFTKHSQRTDNYKAYFKFLVISLHSVTKWDSPNYPCQSMVSSSFYSSPTVTIECLMWDCRGRFVKDIRIWILFCWYLLFSSAPQRSSSFILCFVCWFLFWKNKKLGKRSSKLCAILSHSVTMWSSLNYIHTFIMSSISYCSPTGTTQRCLWNLCYQFFEDISTWISLLWTAIYLSAKKYCLSFNLCFLC